MCEPAEAVGPERFAPDAKAVMDNLLTAQVPSPPCLLPSFAAVTKPSVMTTALFACHVQQRDMKPEDPQTITILHACARIVKVMGEEFLPYLPSILPALLANAAKEPKVRQGFACCVRAMQRNMLPRCSTALR